MSEARPFLLVEDMYHAAEASWFSLPTADQIAAFEGVHEEDSRIAAIGHQEINEGNITEAARLYRDKFGFIFIQCSAGKSSEEMLAICRARYGNSVETELKIAAEEQRKIIEIRLNKLLER